MAYLPPKPPRIPPEQELRLPWWVWAYFLIGIFLGFMLGWLEGSGK